MAPIAGQSEIGDMKQDFNAVLGDSLASHLNFWNASTLLGNIDGLTEEGGARREEDSDKHSPTDAPSPLAKDHHSEFSEFRPERPVSAPATQSHAAIDLALLEKLRSSFHGGSVAEGYGCVLPAEGVITPPESACEQQISWGTSPKRICHNCHTTQTPFWRRWGDGLFYCNACGLYLRTHNRMRPQKLQESRLSKRNKPRVDICKNCQARETPLWRKISTGETVCNACGLYYRLHNAHRPLGLARATSVLTATAAAEAAAATATTPCDAESERAARSKAVPPKFASVDGWHHYQGGGDMEQETAPMPASPIKIPRFDSVCGGSVFMRELVSSPCLVAAAEEESMAATLGSDPAKMMISPPGAAISLSSAAPHSWPSSLTGSQQHSSLGTGLTSFSLIQSLGALKHFASSASLSASYPPPTLAPPPHHLYGGGNPISLLGADSEGMPVSTLYGDASGYHQFYAQYQYHQRPHQPLAGVMAMLPGARGGMVGDDGMGGGEERICKHEEGRERTGGEQEESLDDSMHWFSSTCLGTAFSNPDQQAQ